MNNFFEYFIAFIKDVINNIKPRQLLTNGNIKIDDYYFFAKPTGSSPVSKLPQGQNMPQNRGGVRNEEKINQPQSNPEPSSIDDDVPSNETEVPEEKNLKEKVSETVNEVKEEAKEEAKRFTKDKLKKLTIYNPKFYLILAIILVIIFIILFIIVLFWNTEPRPEAILCGGPSELDSLKVITTDQEGILLDAWDFYEYVGAVVNNEFSAGDGVNEETNPITHQVQAIASVSEALSSGKYKSESELASNLNKYNTKWCPKRDLTEEEFEAFINDGVPVRRAPGTDMVCPELWPEDPKIIVLKNSVDSQTACDPKNGCYTWSSAHPERATPSGVIEKFGVSDVCINTHKSATYGYIPKPRSRWCSVKVELSPQQVEQYTSEGYKIRTSSKKGVKYDVWVTVTAVEKKARPENVLNYYKRITDSVGGVVLTDTYGNPAHAQYKSGGDERPECKERNVRASKPPQLNDMCHNSYNFHGLDMYTQATQRNWPVHKILTFWYNFSLSSWSDLGRSSCEMYPNVENKSGTKILNYLQRDQYNFVDDPKANIATIFAGFYGITEDLAVEDLNNFIATAVMAEGIGTGKGVAAAAISLITILEENDLRLPYSWGGKYSSYGINRKWGIPVSNGAPSDDPNSMDEIIPYGLDCTGFSFWALHNGGLKRFDSHATLSNKHNGDLYRKYEDLVGHSNVGLHGDIIYRVHNGKSVHAKVVIGMLYDYNHVLVANLIAHASGTRSGLIVDMVSVKTGNPMIRYPVYDENTEDIIGFGYAERSPGETSTPYGVIDMSNCYEKRGYTDICTIDSDEGFFDNLNYKAPLPWEEG